MVLFLSEIQKLIFIDSDSQWCLENVEVWAYKNTVSPIVISHITPDQVILDEEGIKINNLRIH